MTRGKCRGLITGGLVFALLAGWSQAGGGGQLQALKDPRERHLANVRQLTFGGQNAEAYWSNDGKRLIYQMRGGDLKADQIFIMNADGSGKHMVSTGRGRCTCAYFLPGDREIIFSSTHA